MSKQTATKTSYVKTVCSQPCLKSKRSAVNPVLFENSLRSTLYFVKIVCSQLQCQNSLQSTLSYVKTVSNQPCLISKQSAVNPVLYQSSLHLTLSYINTDCTQPCLISKQSVVNPFLYQSKMSMNICPDDMNVCPDDIF